MGEQDREFLRGPARRRCCPAGELAEVLNRGEKASVSENSLINYEMPKRERNVWEETDNKGVDVQAGQPRGVVLRFPAGPGPGRASRRPGDGGQWETGCDSVVCPGFPHVTSSAHPSETAEDSSGACKTQRLKAVTGDLSDRKIPH
ncbi:hypothetical protein JEQ12_010812 [Ovis aries]|uniref:Uncharacterized protein n=1 Tax=Ovis aries TaxID=9940 RepID=A0A835ZVS2_SHEEP|nr:hypothetical protein JEQ12_010812 [Ovis aries]